MDLLRQELTAKTNADAALVAELKGQLRTRDKMFESEQQAHEKRCQELQFDLQKIKDEIFEESEKVKMDHDLINVQLSKSKRQLDIMLTLLATEKTNVSNLTAQLKTAKDKLLYG